MLCHPIAPVFDASSRILVLGSFPSVKSREVGFYYAHPQNRFWRLLSFLRNEPTPCNIDEKKAFLLRQHIALWDSIASCEITGSSDSSIRDVTPNDLSRILGSSPIEALFFNGKAAEKAFRLYQKVPSSLPLFTLPSTSPANAACTFDKLADAWRVINEYR